jgi:protein involved in temperature-dependent protein secretion
MSIEQSIEQGEFEAALALLGQATAGPQPDPGQVLMTFNMEVRLQRFAAAEATMRRLMALAPQVAGVMERYRLAARAEATATARLTDPALAGRRKALGTPPPHALAYVKAAVHHAQKDYAGAAAALAEARPLTPPTSGTLTWANGRSARFTNLTDTDDLTGPNLPCYDGDTLLDVPYSQLRSVSFLDCKTSFDVMWMPSEVVTAGGKAFSLRVPSYYTGTGKAAEGMVRAGKETMWEREHGYAQGVGQRDFNVTMADGGSSMVGMLQVVKLEFDVQASAEPEKPKSLWKRIFG